MAEDRSKVRYFIEKEKKKALLDEWLSQVLENAGYAGMDLMTSPKGVIGTRITIRALRPGLIIGRRGARIKELAKEIEGKFGYPNPTISVTEIEVPEFEPRVMAWQIKRLILRGYKYRRVAFWILRSIMEAGAAGAEIVISGKLRTVRSAYEKFTSGVILKSGELAERLVRKAKTAILTKYGIIGVKVSIMPISLEEYLKSLEGEKKEEVEESGEEEG
ncbi:MAG TPA: 30S ribosomal protein S3 [Thermoproteales archaeon]|nr:30S ribosomal protein S3 [Thermoproteales archaeon]